MDQGKKIAIVIFAVAMIALGITVVYAYSASSSVPNNYYSNTSPYGATGSYGSYGSYGNYPSNGYPGYGYSAPYGAPGYRGGGMMGGFGMGMR